VALVTDGKATVQRNKISALALESWLDAVICTDDLLDGATKPSPRPFEVAANRLQTTPTHAAYVGDDTSKDFLGPRALGMRTVRLDRRLPFPLQSCHDFPTAYLPHVTFANLDDAATWLLAESRGTSG
jgi:FMN phosphatase YigB (HAD superfamily)